MPETRDSTGKLLRDYGLAVILAIVVALLIRFFLIEAYRIPSNAMKPTLEAGDTIFVSKSAFGFRLPGASRPFAGERMPQRGEVVVFSPPEQPDRDYIKRVVGLPGDRVGLTNGRLIINGKPVRTEALDQVHCSRETLPSGASYGVCFEPPLLDDVAPMAVAAGSVFVVSDLRSKPPGGDPKTIKTWAVIPVSALRGSALWVWLSIEPRGFDQTGWLPKFRLNRMFRRIE